MGEHSIAHGLEGAGLRAFMHALLEDLRALEQMIEDGRFETGIRRIGAEQELFLVDDGWGPANRAMEVLAAANDPHFTTELGQFNLEINLDPLELQAGALTTLEAELDRLIGQARSAARACGADVALAGILPTIRKSDLGRESMTPLRRYELLDETMAKFRGDSYELKLTGKDELSVRHDNVMLEACNCSFQIHLQVAPDEFAQLYNIAQVATAPVLAAAVNSPVLFGRRLWHETRIALFQQSIDTRNSSFHLRERSPRVSFGRGYVRRSVLELFRSDIARFRALLGSVEQDDPFAALARGETPALKALCTYNGTVWRWNRPCYGVTGGRPHLRIENRVLPCGPTPLDEVSNAAFWYGLVAGLATTVGDVTPRIPFDVARNNFHLAARYGLKAPIEWLDGDQRPAAELVVLKLLPLAQDGLAAWGVSAAEIDRYLGVIEARVTSNRTGARWMLESLASMGTAGTRHERLGALTGGLIARQQKGTPVHEWEPAQLNESGGWAHNYQRVEQFMTTELFTVQADESLLTVAQLMDWERIRHVPVEAEDARCVGLVSYRQVMRALVKGHGQQVDEPISAIMRTELVTVAPESTSLEAIRLMRQHRVGCLPVLKDGRLVGIVTERDFMNVARELIEEELAKATPDTD